MSETCNCGKGALWWLSHGSDCPVWKAGNAAADAEIDVTYSTPRADATAVCNTCGEQQNLSGFCTNKQCSRHGRRNDYLSAEDRAEIEAINQEHRTLVASQKDTERLDWIEANHASFGHHRETGKWWSRAGAKFNTVREAIDAARRDRAP